MKLAIFPELNKAKFDGLYVTRDYVTSFRLLGFLGLEIFWSFQFIGEWFEDEDADNNEIITNKNEFAQ